MRLLLTHYFSVGWFWRASGLYEGWSHVSNWNHQLGNRLWPQRHARRLYKCESLSWLDSGQHETLRKKNELSPVLWPCPRSFLLGASRMLTGLPICPDAYEFQYKRKTNCNVWEGHILKLLSSPYSRLSEANTPFLSHPQAFSVHQITGVQLKINFGPREHHTPHKQLCCLGNGCELKAKGTDLISWKLHLPPSYLVVNLEDIPVRLKLCPYTILLWLFKLVSAWFQ